MLAHDLGSRANLPLPLWMFSWGVALALAVSFVALGMLWTRPRLVSAASGRTIAEQPPLPLQILRIAGQVTAMALYFVALWAGLFGRDLARRNILPVVVFVIVWVGAAIVSGLLGDIWQAISPFNQIARLTEWVRTSVGAAPAPQSAAWGHWPAAVGLLGFLFLELTIPAGDSPRLLGWVLVIHSIGSAVLAWRFGARWVTENEPIAALFTMLSAMAPLSSDERGINIRPPISGLSVMKVKKGTLATLLVVLGGTTFDGFSESAIGEDIFGSAQGLVGSIRLSIGLLFTIGVVSLLYGAGVWWTATVTNRSVNSIADIFTPTLVPIVFGYAIAHYALLLVDETQTFIIHLSDPGGQGWNLFGGAGSLVNLNLISPTAIAWIQVLAVLVGHAGAVLVAHDRSLEVVPAAQAFRSQYVMLFVMVVYSTLGLALLLNA